MSKENEENEEKCSNCLFVEVKQEDVPNSSTYTTVSAHYCRRFPPVFEGIIRVSHDGWCGEYKQG